MRVDARGRRRRRPVNTPFQAAKATASKQSQARHMRGLRETRRTDGVPSLAREGKIQAEVGHHAGRCMQTHHGSTVTVAFSRTGICCLVTGVSFPPSFLPPSRLFLPLAIGALYLSHTSSVRLVSPIGSKPAGKCAPGLPLNLQFYRPPGVKI